MGKIKKWILDLPKIKGISKKQLQAIYERYNPPEKKKD